MRSKVSPLFCLLLGTNLVSAGLIAKRQAEGRSLSERSIQLGWSLQSNTCPSGSTSCGGGACCPSNLFCNPAANYEVAACCPTSSDCRGSAESYGACADTTWSLYQGTNGNGFCCMVGMVGVLDYSKSVAGSCVSSADAVSATTAILRSVGSGGTTITPPITTTTSAGATTTTTSISTSTRVTPPGSTGKPVFFHYMIGTITDAHCEKDILDAKALGADAFALNLNTVQGYAATTTSQLFKWAGIHGFKLFFSFDMTGFNHPNQFTSFLQSYVTNEAYYLYKGLPLVSTFNGGASSYTFGQSTVNNGWKIEFQQVMANAGHPVYFVPSFQDVSASTNFFTTQFPTLDGAMNWDAWPQNAAGNIIVPTADDVTYLNGARAVGKTFLMGVSPLQFKHDPQYGNWYRRGEQNLEYRFGQVLNLQPDFIEIQTWNDAGESHYMGNSWPEPIEGTNIGSYTEDYDHTAYREILPAFIKAYKAGATTTDTMYPTNGKKAQGTFWHHTLLTTSDCSADPIGKPQGVNTVEDKVTVVVLVASGVTTYSVSITSGSKALGSQNLVPGYNQFSVSGLTVGKVTVTVRDSSSNSNVITGTGPLPVVATSNLCNYNFQVVALA